MYSQNYFAIVINGIERFTRTNWKDAARLANKLRSEHGLYSVWVRPHYRLVLPNGSPVKL